MTDAHNAKLRGLIQKTDKLLAKFPELSTIRIWHSDCLRGLRDVYGDASPEVKEWRSILPSLDWGMVYHGEYFSESFFSSDEYKEDEELFQRDYDSYRAFCAGRLLDMRDILLEYLSTPSTAHSGKPSEQVQQVSDQSLPDFGFIAENPKLRQFCSQCLVSAKVCSRQTLYLPAFILLGGALEGMLLSMVEQEPMLYKQAWNEMQQENNRNSHLPELKELKLDTLLRISEKTGWISSGGWKLGDILRDYRNLVHPYKHTNTEGEREEADYLASWAAVQKVAGEINRWCERNTAGVGDEPPIGDIEEQET